MLSGKHELSSQNDTPVALRLDTRLPDLTQPRLDGLTATELSDENTALGRKLAHLEAQLAALQRRNAELEAARHATPTTAPAPATSSQPAQWPLYLLAMAIVASLIALAAWLLRRTRAARPALGDTPWTQTGMPEKTLSELSADMPAEPPSVSPRMPEIAPPQQTSGTEVKEDVLDQAEVFMAFGHGDLAIHLLQEHLRATPTESPYPGCCCSTCCTAKAIPPAMQPPAPNAAAISTSTSPTIRFPRTTKPARGWRRIRTCWNSW